MPGRPSSLCTEHTLMILPRLRGIMRCATARPTKKTLSMLVLVILCQASVGNSANGLRCCMPALLIRMSIAPTSASTLATPASTASASVTSNATASAWKPWPCRACRASCSLAASRAFSTTRAPAVASACASAYPMPLLAPVMRAVRPVRSKIFMAEPFWSAGLSACRRGGARRARPHVLSRCSIRNGISSVSGGSRSPMRAASIARSSNSPAARPMPAQSRVTVVRRG